TSGNRAGKLADNFFGNMVFRTLYRHLFATISEDDGRIIIILSKDFADAYLVDDEHFAAFTLQLRTAIFQRRGVGVACFGGKPHYDSRQRLSNLPLFDCGS